MEHVVEKKIMWGDLDSLGIVFYPRYYEWIDACGHLFFEAIDLNLGELWKTRALQFGLVETGCRYRMPGRYHDMIKIYTRIDSLTSKTILLSHTIRRASTGEVMVEGFERRICMDVSNLQEFRAVDIPRDIYQVLLKAMEKS